MWLRQACLALFLVLGAAPAVAAAVADDGYIEGYVTAILQREFSLVVPSLRVRNGVITLDAADIASVDHARLVAELERIPGVARVEVRPAGAPPVVVEPPPPPAPAEPPPITSEYQVGLLPGNVLFKPLIADPRWPHFSASWQSYVGDPQLENAGSATFGESFALYRGKAWGVWWEVGVHAGVFALFDLDASSADLVNADYMVGVPLSLRYADFSAMLRLLHQSSHLGDEFLLRTRTNRVNLSYQSVDAKLSYELAEIFRVYGGGGYLFGQEPSSIKPWSIQYGAELTSPWPARPARWRPIAAVDVQHRENNDWWGDVSIRAGIQIEGVLLTRKLQILFEYFTGYSPNGQFYTDRIKYYGLGAHFHF
jgi:hypothetical protein